MKRHDTACSVRTIKYYITYEVDEDGVVIASCPAIKGCFASGRTLEEAYRNIKDAVESCLEALRKVKKEIPEAPFDIEDIRKYDYVEEVVA